MNPDPKRLLDEIMGETNPLAFRAEMLEQTLRQVRRKRQVRQWNHRMLVAAIILITGFFVFRINLSKTQKNTLPASSLNFVSSTPLSPAMIVESSTHFLQSFNTPEVSNVAMVQTDFSRHLFHEINDDELLALVNGQPAMLVRRSPHEAELLIVDATTHAAHLIEEHEFFQP